MLSENLQADLRATFLESFMQPQIYLDTYYSVETDNGTEIVPSDLVTLPFGFKLGQVFHVDDDGWFELVQGLKRYTESDKLYDITISRGYLARLSAPGYMDCTDWCAFDTADEAAQYLLETYGDE